MRSQSETTVSTKTYDNDNTRKRHTIIPLHASGPSEDGDVVEYCLTPVEDSDTSSSDCEWDTDLDDKSTSSFQMATGSESYLATCKHLDIVPASYFIRHMKTPDVSMQHYGLGPKGAKAIAVSLIDNIYVTTLDLSDNWLGDDGACCISQMLTENCYITDISLANNSIGMKGIRAICEMFMENSSIKTINLAGNHIGDKAAPYIGEQLLDKSMVTELDLSHNELCGGGALGHWIGENPSLEKLDLSWNNLRGKGAVDVVDGVRKSLSLTSVNLCWNGLANEGAKAMGECIRSNYIVTHIDISNNRIYLDGAVWLAGGLAANESLKVLAVGQNPFGVAGARRLLEASNNERSVLEELNLAEIIVDNDFDSLYKEISGRRDLKVVHGGILWGSKPTTMGSSKTMPDPDSLKPEEIYKWLMTDPVTVLRTFMRNHQVYLKKSLNHSGIKGTYKIAEADFRKIIVKVPLPTPLDNDQWKFLISRLQIKKGIIDYKPLILEEELED